MSSSAADKVRDPSGSLQAFNEYHFSSFAAQELPVTVVPRFSMERVEGMEGVSYGPFTPHYPVEVPLWLGLYFRQTDACTVQLPSYLRPEYLTSVAERERSSERFEPLPFYFFEVAKCLTQFSGSSAPRGTVSVEEEAEARRLVGDIRQLRQRKLQDSMAVLEAEGSPMTVPGIKLTNIVSTELHYLRHTFAVVLTQAAAMDRYRLQRERLPTVMLTAGTPSTATRRTRDTTTTTDTTPSGAPTETPTTTTADVEPSLVDSSTTPTTSVQPPLKKRRTLRQ